MVIKFIKIMKKKVFRKIWQKIKKLVIDFLKSLHIFLRQEPKAKTPWKLVTTLFSTIFGILFSGLILMPSLFFKIIETYSYTTGQTNIILAMIIPIVIIVITILWAFIIYITTDYFPRYYILGAVFLLILPFLFLAIPYCKNSWAKYFSKQ